MCVALPSIGFIGLGIMGMPMAQHLCDAGYSVTVYNRTAAKSEQAKSFGAYVGDSPRKLGERVDILITMLTTPAAVRSVIEGDNGALANPKSGLVWIQMSTLDIQSTKALAQYADSRGVIFVDCPVSGSKKPAEAADLVLLAGAASEPLAYVTPILKRFGKTIVHAGEIGMGTALKLAANLIVAQMTTALAESVAFSRATGLEPAKIFELIAASSSIRCGYFAVKKDPLLKNEFPPAFSLENMAKDVRFIDEESKARGMTLPVTRAVREMLEKAVAENLGQEDVSAVAKVITRAPVSK
jgi:3-hydroxyisobutyrate dehydrogenase-like beta-hydroxyacid dehydrogenase